MDIFVLDTSAFLRDSDILNKLNGEIVIHTIVLEELDSISKRRGYQGNIARKIGNKLYELKNRGDFKKGIWINNSIIKFDDRTPDLRELRFGLEKRKNDNLLLCICKEINKNTDNKVFLVTNDKFFSLKAKMDIEVISTGKKKNRNMKKYINNQKRK